MSSSSRSWSSLTRDGSPDPNRPTDARDRLQRSSIPWTPARSRRAASVNTDAPPVACESGAGRDLVAGGQVRRSHRGGQIVMAFERDDHSAVDLVAGRHLLRAEHGTGHGRPPNRPLLHDHAPVAAAEPPERRQGQAGVLKPRLQHLATAARAARPDDLDVRGREAPQSRGVAAVDRLMPCLHHHQVTPSHAHTIALEIPRRIVASVQGWPASPLDKPDASTASTSRYHYRQEVIWMAALSIRNLDETVKRRLLLRAARHGRSMEAEARAILTEAVQEPADSAGLFTALLDRFGTLGGVDVELPARAEPARGADFSA